MVQSHELLSHDQLNTFQTVYSVKESHQQDFSIIKADIQCTIWFVLFLIFFRAVLFIH